MGVPGDQARGDAPAHDLACRRLVVVDAHLGAEVYVDRGGIATGLCGAGANLLEVVVDRRRHHGVGDEHAVGDLAGEPRDLRPVRREVDRDLRAHGGERQVPARQRDDLAGGRDRLPGQEAAHQVDRLPEGRDRQPRRDAELAEPGTAPAQREQRAAA